MPVLFTTFPQRANSSLINDANAAFEAVIGKELAGVNAKLAGKKLDKIKVMTKEEYDKKQEK